MLGFCNVWHSSTGPGLVTKVKSGVPAPDLSGFSGQGGATAVLKNHEGSFGGHPMCLKPRVLNILLCHWRRTGSSLGITTGCGSLKASSHACSRQRSAPAVSLATDIVGRRRARKYMLKHRVPVRLKICDPPSIKGQGLINNTWGDCSATATRH